MKKTVLIIAIQFIANSMIGSVLKNEPSMIIDTLHSESLQENRLFSVYLPPDFDGNKVYPVVFATDGQLLDSLYKHTLDSLINKGQLPAFIMIGSFSNEKIVEGTAFQYRYYEYVKDEGTDGDLNKRLFDNHMIFFTKELVKYVEQKYPISRERKHRYFYGFSNGAGFGVNMSIERPDLISKYMCFSMTGGQFNKLKRNVDNYPYIDLLYGNKEPFPLTMKVDEFDQYLTKKGYDHLLTVYEGGHDREIWRILFFERLEKLMTN